VPVTDACCRTTWYITDLEMTLVACIQRSMDVSYNLIVYLHVTRAGVSKFVILLIHSVVNELSEFS